MAQPAPSPFETPAPTTPRRSRRWIAIVLVLVLVIALVSAAAFVLLAPRPTSVTRPLRIGIAGQDAATLNPNAMTLTLEFVVVYNVYSTLATRDAKYHVVGDLARTWSVAADNVTWTFNLVRNAFFTDPANPSDRSHPVTADDVVFSYELAQGTAGGVLESYVSEVVSITKVDAYTVRIVTAGPFAAIDSMLTAITIFPEYVWGTITDPIATSPPVPIGSGPFYYDPNSALSSGPIILKRNPNYHGDEEYCQISRPNEVRILYFPSAGAMANSFTSGSDDLDMIYNIPAPTYLSGLTPGTGQNLVKRAVSGGFVGEISLNQITDEIRAAYPDYQNGTSNPLLRDATVRRAIAMSIDKAAIVQYAYFGLATVADTLVPASNPWHYSIPPVDRTPFDPAGARQLLNNAGWSFDVAGFPAGPTTTPLARVGGTDPLRFRFYTPDSHTEFAVASANITAWLAQAGIQTVDSQNRPVPGYEVKTLNSMNDIWKSADFDMWLWDWIFSSVSDPSTDVLQVQTTMAIPDTSDSWYSNATFDALYNESLVTIDPVARRALTDEMQRMLYEYNAYILPYYAQDLYATTNSTNYGYGWENWGDWTQSPGLVPDSNNPSLWFQLYPHDNPPPRITSFPEVTAGAGAIANFQVTASDPNGGALTYIWDFGDGTSSVTTSAASVTHTYSSIGNYTVKVRVEDVEWPTCATTKARIGPTGVAPSNAAAVATPPGGTVVPAGVGSGMVLWVPLAIAVEAIVLIAAAALQRRRLLAPAAVEDPPRSGPPP